ncbi:outer membrane protein [Candidatus Liberibacter solanacearum CLso-ZC1]|uniref:Outer membrane protein n=1 Tax=Liberibacter solanacearum (strain CLso-ZC1) TaxID=658172 RepID=E4UBQ9_LIBSC|nr:outer membrane beta-barrel protein [Candidatus Liberibacter solanacearum]ADR51799.1 outer membrane protein [Candidatus Liberibacter solanacearum CLso-ZC1]
MKKFFLAVGVSTLTLVSFSAVQAADAVQRPQRRQHASVSRGVVPTVVSANRYVYSQQGIEGPYAGMSIFHERNFSGKDHNKDIGGSLFAGYNVQEGDFFYGAEADARYSHDIASKEHKAARLDQKDDAAVSKMYHAADFSGSLRFRGGYEIAAPVVVYGTVGVAAVHKASKAPADAAASPAKAFYIGGTAGLGVESVLVDNIIGRVEYRATKYSGVSHLQNVVSLGLGIRF